MLAVDCLIRGQVPDDYVVTTPVAESQLGSLRDDAEKLLAVGRSLPNQVGLTRRERDVLEALLHNLTNKEISVALGLTERTVKFHVSSLLAKFKVCNRQELVQKALNQVLEALPKLVPSGSLEDRYGSGPLPSGLNAPRSATSQERVQRQAVAPR
jgi:DNA-binding NarL/FixJ family response regulator